MSRCTFESLPNELILLVFEYLSLFDLCQAFCHIANARLVRLFVSKRHSFVPASLRCGEMCQLLDVNNETHLQRFTDLIDTLVLDETLASSVFREHVTKRMDVAQPLNCRFPSMTQLIIFNAEQRCRQTIQLLLPLNFCNHSLRRLHLVFHRPALSYSIILSTLVSDHISFHTMILDVENGTSSDFFSCQEERMNRLSTSLVFRLRCDSRLCCNGLASNDTSLLAKHESINPQYSTCQRTRASAETKRHTRTRTSGCDH